MSRRLKFASIGNANIDLTLRVKSIPKVDTIIQATQSYLGTGGSASNYAYTVARMGAESYFLGAVGDDVFGRYFVSELSAAGVDTSYVEVVRNAATGFVAIWLDDSGEKRGVAWRGANELLRPKPKWTALKEMDMVHIAGCTPKVARWVWRNVEAEKSFDPGSSTPLYTRRQLLEGLTRCKVTYLHSEVLASLEPWQPMLDEFLAHGGIIVEKMGGEGVRLHLDSKILRVKPPRVKTIDTTGAGDVFSAVFDYKLLSGATPQEATIWATAASSIKIMRVGAKSGVPDYQELENYVNKIRSSVVAETE